MTFLKCRTSWQVTDGKMDESGDVIYVNVQHILGLMAQEAGVTRVLLNAINGYINNVVYAPGDVGAVKRVLEPELATDKSGR